MKLEQESNVGYYRADNAKPDVPVVLEETHCVLRMKFESNNTTLW
jgi:hypothetical protein